MSEQWRQKQLGKVCEIILGQSPSSDTYNQERIGLPFFQGKSEFGSKYAQAKTWCSDPLKVAKKEDILISVRAPVGESNLAPENCCIGRGLAALRADQENLLQEFLWHQIDFKKGYLQGISQGSTFDAISGKDLSELELELPPLPEQKKIGEILSGIDDLTQAIERKINKLNDTRREISRDIFSEFSVACLSQDCEVLSLEHACEAVIDCKNRTPPYTEKGYPVIRTPNVRGGKLIFNDLRYTDEESYQTWTARSVPRAMDILFTREAPLGEVCLIPHGFQCCLGQRMMLFRANRSLLDPQYLLFALMSPFVQEQLDRSKGGTTVGHARVADIRNIQIPIPPMENQIKIALSLGSIDASLQHSVEKKKKIQEKKNALASDLLSGRKRVSV